ncbi:Thermostable monoacylglycerol lipase [Fundidesulfovibrio magnetotacticus]|uniref:Thermostable monoacylglycerol lipase n=1 Tax=Fundidesulfovibrio magnetotacticus TaxID=2730080 RepID=A0A6V8LZF4_9BACT|nr:alpha/beta fold hydrolase [Fundidesulfovibrio magnetotacticus]GFK95166.1 Thermostable monoacylglycerol lipase [Fundidesulfovibrio magnetotacticus]
MTRPACLLLHGFGGEPFEMLPLAEALSARGFCVSVPLLPGHGESVEAWNRTGWPDWLACAARDYETLEREHGRVAVLGLSMGGSLSLALAQRYRPAAVVTIASPVFLYRFWPPAATDWRLPLLSLLRRWRPVWPNAARKEESRRIAPWQGYETSTGLNALASLEAGLREVRSCLGKVTAPLLALHAVGDSKVPIENLWEITGRTGSKTREAVVLRIDERVTSRHILTTHAETREEVARRSVGFVEGV